MAAVESLEQAAHLVAVPDVAALELRQRHVPAVDVVENGGDSHCTPFELAWPLSARKEHQRAGEVRGFARSDDELELFDADANRVLLEREDDAGERDALALATPGLDDQVLVAREENASEGGSPIEQLRVGEALSPILVRREHVDAPEPEPLRDRAADVVVEVESDGQGIRVVPERAA